MDAKNVFVYQFDLRSFGKLKYLELIVAPSEEYPGLLTQESEDEEESSFEDNLASDQQKEDEDSDYKKALE